MYQSFRFASVAAGILPVFTRPVKTPQAFKMTGASTPMVAEMPCPISKASSVRYVALIGPHCGIRPDASASVPMCIRPQPAGIGIGMAHNILPYGVSSMANETKQNEGQGIVTAEAVDAVLEKWANMDAVLARLLIILTGLTDIDKSVGEVKEFLANVQALARHPSATSFQFPKQHKCAGKTGRDALNAITDERESNGTIRKLVKEQYRISKAQR